MVQALAKAYGMIVGMGGLGGDLEMRSGGKDNTAEANQNPESNSDGGAGSNDTQADSNEVKDGKGNEKKEKRHDYCKYVAIVTESVSMFQQQKAQQDLLDGDQVKADTSQKASLYKAARSHQERAKTAKVQFAGWGNNDRMLCCNVSNGSGSQLEARS